MKILLISMTVGEGHNSIAKSISASLTTKNIENKTIQLYGYSTKEVSKQNKLFLFACKFIPHIYQHFWNKIRKRNINKNSHEINKVVKRCSNFVLNNINDYNPDVIICTHNYASAVVDNLKVNNLISSNIKTFSVVFDYCLCPYWEFSRNIDYIVTPHEVVHQELKNRGISEDKMLPFGLPVNDKFTKQMDKQQALIQLNLNPNLFTVALYSGGNCISKVSTIIKHLTKVGCPIQIIAICGKNQKEFNRVDKLIKKYKLNNVLNLGFCNCLDVVFSASDIVISRAGGMGLTEQINKHTPFVLREKLIINEKINKQMFTKLGLGLSINKSKDIVKIIDYLYDNPTVIEQMKQKCKEFCKPNSVENFVNFVLSEK